MKEFCHVRFADTRCLLTEGHDGPHSERQAPEEPPLDRQIQILEIADDPVTNGYLWTRIWTFSNASWMTWFADQGLLTEEPLERYGKEDCYYYGPFSWSSMAPKNRITDKGREFLRLHGRDLDSRLKEEKSSLLVRVAELDGRLASERERGKISSGESTPEKRG